VNARSSTAAIVVALLCTDSLHFVFARLLLPYLEPAASGFYIMALSTGVVAGYGGRRVVPGTLWRHRGFFAVIGLLVAGSTALSMEAVRHVDPGTAALLSRSGVLFGLGLGVFWLRERLDRVQTIGAAATIAGVVVISAQPGDYLRLGSVLVLASTFMYSLHAAIVKRAGGGMAFLDFFVGRLLATTIGLLALALAQGVLRWPSPTAWGLLLLTAAVDVVFSRALYYLALRRLPMTMHTIVLTVSPLVAVAWSAVLFGSRPGVVEIVGGIAILAGVLAATGSGRPVAPSGRASSR
jgi:inner membrane transporter RhtA